MRVVLAHSGYKSHLAGGERMVGRLGRGLSRRGHDVVHISGSAEASRRGDVGRRSFSRGEARSLVRSCDVVHAMDIARPRVPLAMSRIARDSRVPFVVTPASSMEVWPDLELGLEVCRCADAVIALTSRERSDLIEQGVSPRQIRRAPVGPLLSPDPTPKEFMRRHSIIGPSVLYIGRKVKFKGYERLLKAARIVGESVPDVSFVFIGSHAGEESRRIFEKWRDDDRIIDLDGVSDRDKHSALLACTMVCLPSTKEVLPLTFVEAWHCAKPVISGPFRGAKELVSESGVGLVTDVGEHKIARAIVTLLSQPKARRRMGAEGKSIANGRYTWAGAAIRTEQSYLDARSVRGGEYR